jgi:hypothetical protein
MGQPVPCVDSVKSRQVTCPRRIGGIQHRRDRDALALLDERRYDPPRTVLVEHGGRWWTGLQSA